MSTSNPADINPLIKLLRPSESAAVIVPCRLRTSSGGRVEAEAVVLQHASDSGREAGVLVIAPPTYKTPLRIIHALPITPSFTATLIQTPPSPTASFFAQSSKPHIGVTLSAGRKVELQFPAAESSRVQVLMKAVRQAVDSSYESPVSHAWLSFYPVSEGVPVPTPTEVERSLEESFGDLDAKDDKDEKDDKEADTDALEKEQDKINAPAEDREEDEFFPNPFAAGFSRTGFVRKQLFARQDKWSTTKPVSIRIVTYNVNDRVPPEGTKELASIVGYGAEDIIVVGLQEVDLRSAALLVSPGADRADAWEKALLAGLGDKQDQYENVATVQYVGVLLIVLVRSELRPEVRMVEQSARGIGLLGFGGNKAGVAVRLKVYDTSLCFVNSHLAAFATQLARRRADYVALRTGISFPMAQDLNPVLDEHYAYNGHSYKIDEADLCFWFGDLNYRLELDDKEIMALVEARNWDTLLTADQLKSDIQDQQSFDDFLEPYINFKPSFKYVHGSTTMDPKRAPAYTDRILYLTNGTNLAASSYTSHDLLWSDHLPVTAVYSVDVRVADEAKRAEELVIVQNELYKLDEMYRASLSVVQDELDFGEVKYRREVKREITLRNTGRVASMFSFKTPAPGKQISKPWFWPFPSSGLVLSGEELKVTVTAYVDERSAPGLTTCADDMNDVLVLQVTGGKDTFITLSAKFLPTIIGLPLEVLPNLETTIRDTPLATRKTLLLADDEDVTDAAAKLKPKASVQPPRQVWRLLEHLMGEGVGVADLWTGTVDMSAVLDVIEAVDTGAEAIPGDARAVAHALLHILYPVPGHLVPPVQSAACAAVQERDDAFGVVERIPSVCANVLIGLTSVVRLCAGADNPDDKTVAALASAVFGGPPAGREGFVRALLGG